MNSPEFRPDHDESLTDDAHEEPTTSREDDPEKAEFAARELDKGVSRRLDKYGELKEAAEAVGLDLESIEKIETDKEAGIDAFVKKESERLVQAWDISEGLITEALRKGRAQIEIPMGQDRSLPTDRDISRALDYRLKDPVLDEHGQPTNEPWQYKIKGFSYQAASPRGQWGDKSSDRSGYVIVDFKSEGGYKRATVQGTAPAGPEILPSDRDRQ